MAQPVWVLSVDLQTKTATFQSGMADAAKSARSAFTEIKSGSAEMSSAVGGHAFASRHAVMALSESFGETMPRAITALLVHIGPLGAALEAAFPFAAIALGAVLLLEHLAKLQAEGQKLTEDQMKFGTAVQTAFNQLDQRLLQSQIKADELRNDHLGALRLQLELIDKQSLDELVKSFGEVAKAADVVFADLKTSWYQLSAGSAGAKNALDQVMTQYDSLMKQGRDKEASDLLRGTRESAQKVLDLQKAAAAVTKPADKGDFGAEVAKEQAVVDLRKMGVGYSEQEIKAQETLLGALNAQATIAEKVAALKNVDKSNATVSTGKEMNAQRSEAAREAAEHGQKMAEMSVAMERSSAAAAMAVRSATVAERLDLDLHLAEEETRIQLAGNKALIDALDRGGKDFVNQRKALEDKAIEISRQGEVTAAGLRAKAQEASYRQELQDLETSEREKIDLTDRGSMGRLAAIDAALKEEAVRNLQSASSYRDLLREKAEAEQQFDMESKKLAAETGKEEAENALKTGELTLAATKEAQALADSARRVTIQQRITEETKAANAEYALKVTALQQEAAALDKGGKDYLNKLKALQDQERQLSREHENQLTQIKDQAEIERNQKILSAEQHFNQTIAAGLTQVLMGHKSFASMMNSIGNEVVSGMMQQAVQSALANDFTRESDAAAAARKAYLAGTHFPFPVNLVMAPVLGAAAFASVMAFQEGTDMVPGIGKGDKVPAMLEPGEGVVPGGVMDGLRNMARSGGMSGGTHYHAHVAPVYNLQALDMGGMEKMLDKHADTLTKHVQNTLRKMNH